MNEKCFFTRYKDLEISFNNFHYQQSINCLKMINLVINN